MTIFDHLNNLTFNKKMCEPEDLKTFDIYMTNRWLSMDKDLLEYVNMLQRITMSGYLTKEQVYRMYIAYLPKRKLFNKYVKRGGEGKYTKELIELMCKYFTVNKNVAAHYLDILFREEGLTELMLILRGYGKTDKEIKTILKNDKNKIHSD